MNKAVELLPCPFCGEIPELEHYGEGYKVDIDCMNLDCDIQPQLIQTRRDIKSAINSWNTRATPSLEAIIAKIEAEKVASSYRPNEPEYYAYKRGLDKAISIIREFQTNQTKGN